MGRCYTALAGRVRAGRPVVVVVVSSFHDSHEVVTFVAFEGEKVVQGTGCRGSSALASVTLTCAGGLPARRQR